MLLALLVVAGLIVGGVALAVVKLGGDNEGDEQANGTSFTTSDNDWTLNDYEFRTAIPDLLRRSGAPASTLSFYGDLSVDLASKAGGDYCVVVQRVGAADAPLSYRQLMEGQGASGTEMIDVALVAFAAATFMCASSMTSS